MPDTVLELGKVTYAHGWMCMCMEFRDKILLRRGECETPRKSNFLKKGKIVISVKIRNFSRSRMTKRTFPLKSSHEIKQPRRISLDFEVVRISRFSRRGVSETHGKVRRCHMAPQKV